MEHPILLVGLVKGIKGHKIHHFRSETAAYSIKDAFPKLNKYMENLLSTEGLAQDH